MCIGVGQARLERVFPDHRIGIEQQDMPSSTRTNRLVVGHRKAHVVLVGDHMNPRKPFSDHVHRAIYAPVVYHPYVQIQVVHGPLNRDQTLLEERPNVVANNDDTQVGHPLYGRRFNKELDNVASSAYCSASPTATPRARAVSNTSESASFLAK